MPSKHFFEQMGLPSDLAEQLSGEQPQQQQQQPLPPATQPIPPQPPPQNLTALDAITLAARSLKTVILNYTDAKGVTTVRECEPYSLRPGKAGSTRFFGFDYLRGNIRGFRMDRVARAEMTTKPFVPKWQVEL